MYADTITKSMELAICETDRRRAKQIEYNSMHGIIPQSVFKAIPPQRDFEVIGDKGEYALDITSMTKTELAKISIETEATMKKYAEDLDFENAIKFRDKLKTIKDALGEIDLS
jgi:excinuclease ABC subunit B